jgi:long-chain fatty acid transport protein
MMNKNTWKRVVLALGCAAGAGLFARTAAASGFEAARFGGEHGHAAGATPFALYYNPAALTTTERVHIAGNLTLALHGASYTRASSDVAEPSDAVGANTGKASLFNALAAPALAASMRFGDLTAGLGVFVPFGGQQAWDGNSKKFPGYPGAQDGVARWWLQDGSTSVLYASAGLGYKIRPWRLSLGASGNLTYTALELTRALTPTGRYDDALASEGRTHIDVAGVSGSFGLGVLWEAIENKLWAGLSYQAPPGLYKEQELDGKMRLAFSSMPTTTNVTMYMSLPDVIRFALRARPKPTYELRLFGDFTRWSVHDRQCLAKEGTGCELNADGGDPSAPASNPVDGNVRANQLRNWKNSFGVRAGGSYYFSHELEGIAGVGYDSGAIPMSTLDPSVIDGVNLSGTLGGRVRVAELVSFMLSYTYQGYFERDSTGKNRLADASMKFPSRLPDSGGVYTQWVGTFNAMVEVHLK